MKSILHLLQPGLLRVTRYQYRTSLPMDMGRPDEDRPKPLGDVDAVMLAVTVSARPGPRPAGPPSVPIRDGVRHGRSRHWLWHSALDPLWTASAVAGHVCPVTAGAGQSVRSFRLGRWRNVCGCVRSMMTRAGGWCGSCAGARVGGDLAAGADGAAVRAGHGRGGDREGGVHQRGPGPGRDPQLQRRRLRLAVPEVHGRAAAEVHAPQRREIKKIAKSRPVEHGLPFSTWSLSSWRSSWSLRGWSTTSATRACACCSARKASPFNA